MIKIKKAIIGIADFENGDKILSQIIDLSIEWIEEVHLLHVLDTEKIQQIASFKGETMEKGIKRSEQEAQNFIDNLLVKFGGGRFHFTHEIKVGRVSEIIVESSKKQKADIIIMMTHRHRLARRLQKNHVRYVVELAKIPVLLLPEKE